MLDPMKTAWRDYRRWLRLPTAVCTVAVWWLASFVSFAMTGESGLTNVLEYFVIYLVIVLVLISMVALVRPETRAHWYRW